MAKITDLPLELLTKICWFLCDHCQLPPNCRTVCARLPRLLRSCRKLRIAAEPFVYHKIRWLDNDTALINHLLANPELARHVRSTSRWPFHVLHGIQGQAENTEAIDMKSATGRLLPFMENLEYLDFRGGENDTVFAKAGPIIKPTLRLEKLRSLQIGIEEYSDPFDLTNPGLHEVLVAAPHLESLSIDGFTIPETAACSNLDHLQPTLSSLRRLTIGDDSIYPEQFAYLKGWLKLCSKLETLLWSAYAGQGPKEADEIMSILEPLGETLLKLHLNIHVTVYLHCEPGDFDPFKRLEELILPCNMLCDCPTEPAWSDSVGCPDSIANLLPPTVKRLTLLTEGPGCRGWGHAKHLSHQLLNGSDLQLKRLRMYLQGRWTELNEAERSEVERTCSVEDVAMVGLDLREAFALTRVKVQMTWYFSPIRYEGSNWGLTNSDDSVEYRAYTDSTVDEDSERGDESEAEVEDEGEE